MLAIIDFFLQITLRRRGPEDLPDSRFLLLAAALCYTIVQMFLALPIYSLSVMLFRSVLIDIGLPSLSMSGLISIRWHVSWYWTTLTSDFGTSA